jgi:hypothetical protein
MNADGSEITILTNNPADQSVKEFNLYEGKLPLSQSKTENLVFAS